MKMKKKIYLLERQDEGGYDTYDSLVVCASNEDEAKLIRPDYGSDSWVSADKITVTYIGVADKSIQKGLIHSSFNAG